MKDALDEALLLSDKCDPDVDCSLSLTIIGRIVQELIATIVVDVAALYKSAEAIALLDLLWSFSYVSISKDSALNAACSNLVPIVRNYGLATSLCLVYFLAETFSCAQFDRSLRVHLPSRVVDIQSWKACKPLEVSYQMIRIVQTHPASRSFRVRSVSFLPFISLPESQFSAA